ncbi:hypothetical protein BJY04DRAFT_111975 [Aspergillus karnatakaensis]|uniref:uncharacterized protein n=1 Tax=Aspergillus karnatakaensis TaxID=1810916 RepID=UPI003CCD4369
MLREHAGLLSPAFGPFSASTILARRTAPPGGNHIPAVPSYNRPIRPSISNSGIFGSNGKPRWRNADEGLSDVAALGAPNASETCRCLSCFPLDTH